MIEKAHLTTALTGSCPLRTTPGYAGDRTDRSLILAWPSAIRPIAAVEHLLFRPFRLRSRSAYQGRSSRPRPLGAAALRLVFGTDNCVNAISAPKNGSSTAALAEIIRKEDGTNCKKPGVLVLSDN